MKNNFPFSFLFFIFFFFQRAVLRISKKHKGSKKSKDEFYVHKKKWFTNAIHHAQRKPCEEKYPKPRITGSYRLRSFETARQTNETVMNENMCRLGGMEKVTEASNPVIIK